MINRKSLNFNEFSVQNLTAILIVLFNCFEFKSLVNVCEQRDVVWENLRFIITANRFKKFFPVTCKIIIWWILISWQWHDIFRSIMDHVQQGAKQIKLVQCICWIDIPCCLSCLGYSPTPSILFPEYKQMSIARLPALRILIRGVCRGREYPLPKEFGERGWKREIKVGERWENWGKGKKMRKMGKSYC